MMARVIRFFNRPGLKNWFKRKLSPYGVFGKEAKKISQLVYVCYRAYDYSKSSKNPELAFNVFCFNICQKLKEKEGTELPLPGAWYIYGWAIDWPSLDEIIGKIGWGVDGPDTLYGDK